MTMNKNDWVGYMHNRIGIEKSLLEQEFDRNYRMNKVRLFNSVTGENIIISSDELMNKFTDHIITESGAIFVNQDVKEALPSKTIKILGALRNEYKSEMKKSKERGDLLQGVLYNIKQGDVKTGQNTWYGIQLNVFSKNYNYDVASSITARGRGTVSMNGLTMESCFGVYRPYNVLALLDYIERSSQKYVPREFLELMPLPTREEVYQHVICEHKNYYGEVILKEKIATLNDDSLKKVFYTSNYGKFITIPRVKELLDLILTTQNRDALKISPEVDIKKYKSILWLDPLSPPDSIKEYVEEYKMWVNIVLSGYYWYEGDKNEEGAEYDAPEDIFKNITRQCVVITDTDSLIMTLQPSMDKIEALFGSENMKHMTSSIDEKFKGFIIGSSVVLTSCLLTDRVLEIYTDRSHIPKEHAGVIAYKQEFFFRTLQTTKGAKNYLGIISVQEGVYLPNEDIDLKGLSLKKANFNAYLSDMAKHIAVNMIAKVNVPNIKDIFNELDTVRTQLPEIFRRKNNLDIFTATKLKTDYTNTPRGEYRFKAVENYNILFDDEINLPGVFLMCKIDLKDKDDEVQERYPEIYKKILKILNDRSIYKSITRIKNKTTKMYGENIPDDVAEIMKELEVITDLEELKDYVRVLKKTYKGKDQEITDWIKLLSVDTLKLDSIDKIAVPIDTEIIPEFISNYVDVKEIGVFENLISVIITGLGFEVVRNNSNKQIIHNIVSHY